jgi:NADH-quinone oxidoreductase subunit N
MTINILNNIFIFNSFYFNITSFIFLLVIPILTFLKKYFELKKINFFESLLLISFLIGFSVTIIFSHDIIIIYILLEVISFILYAILGIQYDNIDRSDGIIKYFLLNTLASLLILFGISLLFGMLNEVNYIKYSLSTPITPIPVIISILFILLGIFFKVGSFPLSIWTIDVYETVPFIFTVILLTIIKVSYLIVLFNFLYETLFIQIIFLKWALLISGVSSILIGCFGSLLQKKLKRFIAYTTINQVGFILLGYSSGTIEGFIISFIYILVYTCLNINFFFIINFFKNSVNSRGLVYLTDFEQIAKTHFKLVLNFVLILFAFAGLPPLVGFFIKYFLFINLFEVYTNIIFIIGVTISLIISLISTYYYLRFIKIILFDKKLFINSIQTNNFLILNLKLFFITLAMNFYFYTAPRITQFLVYFLKIEFVNFYLYLFVVINIIGFSSFAFFYPLVNFIVFFYKSFLLI